MRPEQSEAVLNETRLRGSTVRHKIRDEGQGKTNPPPRHSSLVPLRQQQGFAIVAAIFLIVVLALLATGMVQIASTSHTSLTQEYTSARAYLAARSGLQWGMYQTIYTGSGNSTITFSNGALAGTQANLTSVSTTVDGDTFFTIDSRGIYGSSTDAEYSRRQLRLRFNP